MSILETTLEELLKAGHTLEEIRDAIYEITERINRHTIEENEHK